jgi:AcrR family transcriptional regulator
MPPKIKLTKKTIMSASLNIVRESGVSGLNARAIASGIGCSTQPIYSLYANMDELKADMLEYANQYFGKSLKEQVERETKVENGFLKFGLSYINFAKQEPNIFKLLFLSDSWGAVGFHEMVSPVDHSFILESIGGNDTKMSDDGKQRYFLDMWVYTHGVAMMAAFGGMNVSDDEVIEMLTRVSKAIFQN